MRNTRRISVYILTFVLMFLLVACGSSGNGKSGQSGTDAESLDAKGPEYDSEDTAVVISQNATENKITLLNLDLNKQYTLHYSARTTITDKYGSAIVWQQIRPGDMVRVRFTKRNKEIESIMLSPDAWYFSQVTKYTIEGDSLLLGEDNYRLNSALVVASGENLVTLDQILPQDEVTVVGIDRTVYSIIVDKGHGYLSLVNADKVSGGWLQVGSRVETISDGMILTISEGSYSVLVSYKGINSNYEIIIERGQETELDLGDIEVVDPTVGSVIFKITPENAKLYIDSVETDYTNPVIMTTGIHQLILVAEGYQTSTQYINVGAVLATVELTMVKNDNTTDNKDQDKKDEEKKEDKSDSDANSDGNADNAGSENSSGQNYTVSILSPADVEIYVDGTYMGLAPLSFGRPAGNYVFTLRKTGCQTRNYSVNLEGDDKNQVYNFATLLPLEQ